MPLRTAEVETWIRNTSVRREFSVPIIYTDELVETSVYDLAYSSIHGGFLPYIFVGWFLSPDYKEKWWFASARRHEEMKNAIERHEGRSMQYVPTQMNFHPQKLESGELVFESCHIHGDLPNREQRLKELVDLVKPGLFEEEFTFYFVNHRFSLYYYPDNGTLQTKPR